MNWNVWCGAALLAAAGGCNSDREIQVLEAELSTLRSEVNGVKEEVKALSEDLEEFVEGGAAGSSACRPLTVTVKDVVGAPGHAHYFVEMPAHGTHPYSSYDVYAAPISPTSGDQDAIISSTESGVFEASSGWAYFFGTCPHGKTTRVTAVGAGTKFVLRIDGSTHWVYLLKPPEASGHRTVELTHSSGGSPAAHTLPAGSDGEFLNVTYGVTGTWQDIDATGNDAHKTFINTTAYGAVRDVGIGW
jgi:hypothetical protein